MSTTSKKLPFKTDLLPSNTPSQEILDTALSLSVEICGHTSHPDYQQTFHRTRQIISILKDLPSDDFEKAGLKKVHDFKPEGPSHLSYGFSPGNKYGFSEIQNWKHLPFVLASTKSNEMMKVIFENLGISPQNRTRIFDTLSTQLTNRQQSTITAEELETYPVQAHAYTLCGLPSHEKTKEGDTVASWMPYFHAKPSTPERNEMIQYDCMTVKGNIVCAGQGWVYDPGIPGDYPDVFAGYQDRHAVYLPNQTSSDIGDVSSLENLNNLFISIVVTRHSPEQDEKNGLEVSSLAMIAKGGRQIVGYGSDTLDAPVFQAAQSLFYKKLNIKRIDVHIVNSLQPLTPEEAAGDLKEIFCQQFQSAANISLDVIHSLSTPLHRPSRLPFFKTPSSWLQPQHTVPQTHSTPTELTPEQRKQISEQVKHLQALLKSTESQSEEPSSTPSFGKR